MENFGGLVLTQMVLRMNPTVENLLISFPVSVSHTNVYDDENILSLVMDSSPHSTHVAGIATTFHANESLLNGVAPGAQLICFKIGDSCLAQCDLINMSYGEPTLLPDYDRFVDLVNEVVNKHRVVFVSSADNNGPALTTVGVLGCNTSSIIGVGVCVYHAMDAGVHALVGTSF